MEPRPDLLLYVAGILSANLALVNILPFPPLDGGRMLMIAAQGDPGFGKRISLRAEQLTYVVGFVVLFAFLIWITVFDIARLLGGGAARDLARRAPAGPPAHGLASTSAASSSAPRTRSSSSR